MIRCGDTEPGPCLAVAFERGGDHRQDARALIGRAAEGIFRIELPAKVLFYFVGPADVTGGASHFRVRWIGAVCQCARKPFAINGRP